MFGDPTNALSEPDIDDLHLAARAHPLKVPRKVPWTAINSPLSSPPERQIATRSPDMSANTTSQSCSKFRDRILGLTSSLAEQKAAQPKRRKRPTPRKKRKVSVDLVVLEDGSLERPSKVPPTDDMHTLTQSVFEASSSMVNILANRTQRWQATQIQRTEEEISKADARAVNVSGQFEQSPQNVFHWINRSSNGQQRLSKPNAAFTSPVSPTDTVKFAIPKLPTTLAPSPSISDNDFLEGDDSIFDDLPDPSTPSSTPMPFTKIPLSNFPYETPMPPYLIPNHTPSQTSESTPVTPPPIKPFIRQPSIAERFPNLLQIPTLKPEHRIQTCFRIAEILRLQSKMKLIRPSPVMTIELYSRVRTPSSAANAQSITFTDLFFPDRPPYLTATYNKDQPRAANTDSDTLRLCRAIVKLASAPNSTPTLFVSPPKHTVTAEVLNIRDSNWEEIRYVRGIVEPEYQSESGFSMSNVDIEARV